MTVIVRHSFSSPKADSPTAASNGEVLPSHWNADHTVVDTTERDSLAALLSDNSLTYSTLSPNSVAPDDIIRTRLEGFAYRVALAIAADHHLTTAGGVKLYVQPEGGRYNCKAFNAKGDGVTDDAAALLKWQSVAVSGYMPRGSYVTSSPLDFTNIFNLVTDDATIIPTFDAGIAVKWSAATGALIENRSQYGKLTVAWPTWDWTKARQSFEIKNSYNGVFEFASRNATIGLMMVGDGGGTGMGCVHNVVTLREFYRSMVGIWLKSQSAAGWCNANIFRGGFMYGAATGPEVAAGLYPAIAGHIYVEGSPYACNGNVFDNQELEWVGTSFRLARINGTRNHFRPRYCEVGSGDTTWIVDAGTENVLDLNGVPYAGFYDPTLAGSANRVDASLATSPTILSSANYVRSVYNVQHYLRTGGPRPTQTLHNDNGPALELAGDVTGPRLRMLNPIGTVAVEIPNSGDWTVNAGLIKIGFGAAAPTSGTYGSGSFYFNTIPTELGSTGSKYLIDGWTCISGGTPGEWRERRSPTGN